MMKCPNCGAPMTGETCAYCGSVSARLPAEKQEKISRGKRNALDWILIVIGVLWCLVVLNVIIDLGYWRPIELTAGLFAASPGIVCLLIGFRRKKR